LRDPWQQGNVNGTGATATGQRSINQSNGGNQSINCNGTGALGQEQLGQAQQEQVQWQWGNGGNSDRSIDRVVLLYVALQRKTSKIVVDRRRRQLIAIAMATGQWGRSNGALGQEQQEQGHRGNSNCNGNGNGAWAAMCMLYCSAKNSG
jgi:hypothetical protein